MWTCGKRYEKAFWVLFKAFAGKRYENQVRFSLKGVKIMCL